MKHILSVNHSLPNFLCDIFSRFIRTCFSPLRVINIYNVFFSFLFHFSFHSLIVVVLILPVFMLFIFFSVLCY